MVAILKHTLVGSYQRRERGAMQHFFLVRSESCYRISLGYEEERQVVRCPFCCHKGILVCWRAGQNYASIFSAQSIQNSLSQLLMFGSLDAPMQLYRPAEKFTLSRRGIKQLPMNLRKPIRSSFFLKFDNISLNFDLPFFIITVSEYSISSVSVCMKLRFCSIFVKFFQLTDRF